MIKRTIISFVVLVAASVAAYEFGIWLGSVLGPHV